MAGAEAVGQERALRRSATGLLAGVMTLALVLALAQPNAEAAIVGVGSQITQISPPSDARAQQLESSDTMFTWDEQQDVLLAADVAVDITAPGEYMEVADLTPGVVPAGTTVRSHIVHADKVGTTAPNIILQGTVTFDQDIVGIALEADTLYGSDFLGAPGTRYPTSGRPERRLNLDGQDDWVIWQIDNRTVVIQVETAAHFDQVRILTAKSPDPDPVIGKIKIQKYTKATLVKQPDKPKCVDKHGKAIDCKPKFTLPKKGWKQKDWIKWLLYKKFGHAGSTKKVVVTGSANDDLGSKASTAPGPSATLGTEVVWTYLVSNPGPAPLGEVAVSDDAGTPGDLSDDFLASPVMSGNRIVGDTNDNGLLDPGETWRFRATGLATTIGQYRNIGWATGTPVDAAGNPSGPPVNATDASHYFGKASTANQCTANGKAKSLVFRYTGDSAKATKTSQSKLSYLVLGDAKDAPSVRIVVTDGSLKKVSFDGVVGIGQEFLVEGTASADRMASQSIAWVYSTSGKLVQTVYLATGCSQPLVLGDQWGSIQLVGYYGEKGSIGVIP